MGCGCGKNRAKIKVIRPQYTASKYDAKSKKCPKCKSTLISIKKYSKTKKAMVATFRCSNKSCGYVS